MATQAEVRRAELNRERRRRPVTMVALRLAELNRVLTDRHGGEVLADDDAGRDDVELVAHHLGQTQDPARRIASWIGLRAPWMREPEAETIIAHVIAKPIRWRADTLAKRLNLTDAERGRLRIKTIGAVDLDREQRAARRRDRKRDRDRDRATARRIAKGRKPRSIYLATALTVTEPWATEGISRRTWERRRARVASPSSNISLSVY